MSDRPPAIRTRACIAGRWIGRIAPLLDALSDQMHRVPIDSFQPRAALCAQARRGYLNDIQVSDLRSIPILLRRTAGWWFAQRGGMASPPHRSPSTRRRRSTSYCGSSNPPCDGGRVAAIRLILDPGLDNSRPRTRKHRCTCCQTFKS